MIKFLTTFIISFISLSLLAQNYTSYFTGSTTDYFGSPQGGVCMMGGATEDDNAMKWFLNQSGGGDILVLRASGSDGYNDYLYSELGITINSVETIVFNNATAADEVYIHQKIQQAEGIWFAGGDQWDYISYWRNSTVATLINEAIQNKNIVIGGTSAGMAILGEYYFSAENGTVTSDEALANPYRNDITIDATPFLQTPFLANTITDTHYDDPDRKGRHTVFLSRILQDWGIEAKGIACNEYTAVCIPPSGDARVFGGYPQYDEFAYFLQVNCELENALPENCSENNPLDWNKGGEAIKVYKVPGVPLGNNTFNLNDWQSGEGGTWHNWYVDNGTFVEDNGNNPTCTATSIQEWEASNIAIYPNPSTNGYFEIHSETIPLKNITISDISGKIVSEQNIGNAFQFQQFQDLETGIYFIKLETDKSILYHKIIIQ